MARRAVKISPIKKTYNPSFKSFESSLADKGYVRSPGTRRSIMPKMEADGRYRTGLDPDAQYIKKLSEEEQKAEKELIAEITKELRSKYPDTNFGPRSKVWNAWSDEPFKVTHIPLSNDTIILNPANSDTDLLNYCWLRVHPDIARSLEAYNRAECPECQYYLANEESENRALYNRKKQINKAIVTFEGLTPSKQKQIARLMDLPITDDSTDESVYNLMDTTLKQPEFERGEHKGKSTLNFFEDLVKMKDERLHIKDLIEQAIRHNIYRKGSGDKIQEGSETIAGSKDELVNFLLDDENQKELLALETRIKHKKISA